jgi:hypothetical protein
MIAFDPTVADLPEELERALTRLACRPRLLGAHIPEGSSLGELFCAEGVLQASRPISESDILVVAPNLTGLLIQLRSYK